MKAEKAEGRRQKAEGRRQKAENISFVLPTAYSLFFIPHPSALIPALSSLLFERRAGRGCLAPDEIDRDACQHEQVADAGSFGFQDGEVYHQQHREHDVD